MLVATSGHPQTVHISHCMAGCPELNAAAQPVGTELIVRHLFVASINLDNGLANWVAYRVLRDTVGVASLLPRQWQVDQLVDADSRGIHDIDRGPRFSQPDLRNQPDRSYRISEIRINPEDRGHLVPLSSFAGTPYWDELNYLSNMSPIPSDLRTGAWSRLDQAVNELAARIGEVYVLSGPLYRIQQPLSSRSADVSSLPAAYFKIIATGLSHAAFVFDQNLSQHAHYCEQLSSLQQIEQSSDLHFFPEQENATTDDLQINLGCSD